MDGDIDEVASAKDWSPAKIAEMNARIGYMNALNDVEEAMVGKVFYMLGPNAEYICVNSLIKRKLKQLIKKLKEPE